MGSRVQGVGWAVMHRLMIRKGKLERLLGRQIATRNEIGQVGNVYYIAVSVLHRVTGYIPRVDRIQHDK